MPGLPNTRLIPDGWEAHHAPTAEQAMTAECVITRPASNGTPVFDAETGRSLHPDPVTVYTGAVRVQRSALTGGNIDVVADKPTPLRQYVVSLPLTAPQIQVADRIAVTAATDPLMVGKILTVADVRGGSLVWQRDLLCDEHVPITR